jgi:hypothetical protein
MRAKQASAEASSGGHRGGQPTHLVVLLHGVAGSPANLTQLEVKLRQQLGAEALVLVPGVYSLAVRLGSLTARLSLQAVLTPPCACSPLPLQRTWDGVDVCAARVLRLLLETVSAHPSLRHVSLFGYSFGGLVARYLAGALEVQSPPFLGLTPLNLVTSATPHLGVFLLTDAAQRRTAASVSALGGRTGQQLVLRDEQQLLALMCHPDSAFTRGAARFRRRSLYANVANDRTVPFWTAWFAPMSADGRPAGPPLPRAAAQSPDRSVYPHIIWEGSAAEADAAPKGEESSSEATESEATMPASAVLPESVEAAQDALSHLNRAKLFLLAPLLVLLFPIWLAIVPGTITLLGLYKHHTQRVGVEQPTEMSHLMDGRLWSEVMREEADAGTVQFNVQRRMAERLNNSGWQKVAVHFSLSREGLLALHTHGLIVHRRLHLHVPGADVVQHCVDNWALDTA